jgi:hypothetical protein
MPTKLYLNTKIRGVRAPNGEEPVLIKQDGRGWFVPRASLLTDAVGTIATLTEQGLVSGGRGYIAQIMEDVLEIGDFVPMEILANSGWNGPLFARGDGEILSPRASSSGDIPGVAYYRYPSRFRRFGRRKDWKQKIAPELLNSDVALFLMCIPFAAVVHRLMPTEGAPPAFQVVTGDKQGRVRRIALSVTGSMAAEGLVTDPIERVLRQPERYIEASRDNLLILGDIEGYLCGSNDKKRMSAVRQLVFDHLLANGGSTNSNGAPAPAFLTVESQPLAAVLGLDATAAERLQQTVPVINIPPGTFVRPDDHAVLAGAPKKVWAKATDEMVNCFGHALREFQLRLVEKRSAIGLADLQLELSADFDTFCAQVERIIGSDNLPTELVRPLALVHAALKMAERLRVLPKVERKPPAVWSVFKTFLADRPKPLTAARILAEVARKPGVLKLEDITSAMGKDDLQAVPAFTKELDDGRRELWVLTSQRRELFDWPIFSKLPDFETYFRGKSEKDRMGGKRVIGKWDDARVIRFRLP